MLGPDGTEASRALEAACHTRSTSQHFPTAPPAARTSQGRIQSIPFNLELQMFQEHKIYDHKSLNRGHLDQNNRCSERVLPGKDPGILVSASFLSSPEPPLNLAGQWRELFSLVNVSKAAQDKAAARAAVPRARFLAAGFGQGVTVRGEQPAVLTAAGLDFGKSSRPV